MSKKNTSKKGRVEDLILYILANYNNERLTPTKLNKLLYFCDFDSYATHKKSITDGVYINNNYGPTLADMPKILKKMIVSGKINEIKEQNFYGQPQTRFVVSSNNLTFNFDDDSLQVIKDVNERYRELKSSELGVISHFDPPYLVSKKGKPIEYKNVIFRDEEFEINESERTEWNNLLSLSEKKNLLRVAQ